MSSRKTSRFSLEKRFDIRGNVDRFSFLFCSIWGKTNYIQSLGFRMIDNGSRSPCFAKRADVSSIFHGSRGAQISINMLAFFLLNENVTTSGPRDIRLHNAYKRNALLQAVGINDSESTCRHVTCHIWKSCEWLIEMESSCAQSARTQWETKEKKIKANAENI